MSTALKTVLLVLAVVVVAAALFFGGMFFARMGPFAGRTMMPAYAVRPDNYPAGPGMMQNWGGGYGPGMMGDWGGGYGPGPGMMQDRGGYGPGMMGDWGGGYGPGPGMMQNRGGYGPGMMGNYGWGGAQSAQVTPLTIDEARQSAADYLETLGIEGLEVGEVMIFDNHAYVVVEETATGIGAFELLVDPLSKTAYPEHGPNMMWNLKYGGVNHGGMMGRGMMGAWQNQNATPTDVDSAMPITVAQALEAAQAYLDQNVSGATATTTPVQFYGYYTFDFEQNGREAGMLSVNGYNGQVFLHTWHGTFIEEAE